MKIPDNIIHLTFLMVDGIQRFVIIMKPENIATYIDHLRGIYIFMCILHNLVIMINSSQTKCNENPKMCMCMDFFILVHILFSLFSESVFSSKAFQQ